MKGDFSRGHNPDRKRGRTYRRVLAQEGRLILDSDLNALVDAQDHTMRRMSAELGCAKGSPDLGFLITPGRLQALFRDLDAIEVTAGALDTHRDFQHKYLERYPALYVGNTSAAPGTLTITLRAPTTSRLNLWLRSNGAVTLEAGGASLNVNSTGFVVHTITPAPGTTHLELSLDPGEEVWVGLIEEYQDAGDAPHLWSTAGRFTVEGLGVEQGSDGPYPDLLFDPFTTLPQNAAFTVDNLTLAQGDRVIAYLEAWERHLSAVEDNGILEVALGGRDDTTTRTQALGQVKLAVVTGNVPAEDLRAAFSRPAIATGALDVSTLQAGDTDPCALELQGGYSGGDNRLYRFEVHLGGPAVGSCLKWSRNNGSDLYRATGATMAGSQINELTFPPHVPLTDGDLVEVLNEFIDTTDASPATITSGPVSFTPATRRTGALVRLHSVAGGSGGKTFSMSSPDDDSLVISLQGYGDPTSPDIDYPKVRLWHGLIKPTADPHQAELEDGVAITVTGSFRVGDYWHYEARARGANDNGPFQTSPHGPERLFAPLAMLEYQGANDPLVLLNWLDERFPSLCEITADDVAFDGARVEAETCDTVQEAIEKLFERGDGGCCDVTLLPNGVDDAGQISNLLDTHLGDLHICLKPGIYAFPSTVEITGRTVVLRGCPDALIDLQTAGDPAFRLMADGRLGLENLTVFAASDVQAAELIAVEPQALAFEAESVGLLQAGASPGQSAIRLQGAQAPTIDPQAPADGLVADSNTGDAPSVRLDDCVVVSGWALTANTCRSLTLRGSACYGLEGGVASLGIGRSDLVETTVVAGAELAATAAWTAYDVVQQGTALIEDLATAEPVPGGAAALAVGSLTRGVIVSCRFSAAVSVAAYLAEDLSLSTNQHLSSAAGVAIYQALNVTIDGETIRQNVDTFTAVGVHLVADIDTVVVRDCAIEGGALGVLLGADIEEQLGPDIRSLKDVRVLGNNIRAEVRGIQVGSLADAQFASTLRVQVDGNDVAAQELAIYARSNAPSQDLGSSVPSLRTVNNQLAGPRGILVLGAGHEVESNRIRLTQQDDEGYGLLADATQGVVIENNLIENDNDVSGDNTLAYWIRSGTEGRLASNVARTSSAIGALRVTAHSGLELVGNRFGLGNCLLSQVDGAEVHGNHVAGRLLIDDSRSGSVRDNRVGTAEQANLEIVRVTGSWQVADNRVSGTLELRPRITAGQIYYPGLEIPQVQDGDLPVLGYFKALAIQIPESAIAIPQVDASEQAAAYYAVANEAWEEDWSKALLGSLDRQHTEQLLDNGWVGDDFAFAFDSEVTYQAQVVGNWSEVLQVGSQVDNVSLSPNSVIQVVANQATQELLMRSYARAVVASNAAGDYSGWINTQTTAVNTDNLEF